MVLETTRDVLADPGFKLPSWSASAAAVQQTASLLVDPWIHGWSLWWANICSRTFANSLVSVLRTCAVAKRKGKPHKDSIWALLCSSKLMLSETSGKTSVSHKQTPNVLPACNTRLCSVEYLLRTEHSWSWCSLIMLHWIGAWFISHLQVLVEVTLPWIELSILHLPLSSLHFSVCA